MLLSNEALRLLNNEGCAATPLENDTPTELECLTAPGKVNPPSEPAAPTIAEAAILVAKLPQWQSQASLSSAFDIHEVRKLLRVTGTKFLVSSSKECLVSQLLRAIQQGKYSFLTQAPPRAQILVEPAGINSWAESQSLLSAPLMPLHALSPARPPLRKSEAAVPPPASIPLSSAGTPTPTPAPATVLKAPRKMPKRILSSRPTGIDPAMTQLNASLSTGQLISAPTAATSSAREAVVLYRPQDYGRHTGVLGDLERVRVARLGDRSLPDGRDNKRSRCGGAEGAAEVEGAGPTVYFAPSIAQLSDRDATWQWQSCHSELQTALKKIGGPHNSAGSRASYENALEAYYRLRLASGGPSTAPHCASVLALAPGSQRIAPFVSVDLHGSRNKHHADSLRSAAPSLGPKVAETALNLLRDRLKIRVQQPQLQAADPTRASAVSTAHFPAVKVITVRSVQLSFSTQEVSRPDGSAAVVIQAKHQYQQLSQQQSPDSMQSLPCAMAGVGVGAAVGMDAHKQINNLLAVGDELVLINGVSVGTIFRCHCEHARSHSRRRPELMAVVREVLKSLSRPVALGFIPHGVKA